eukprot:4430771-Pyramimonas_sp.AAC.1
MREPESEDAHLTIVPFRVTRGQQTKILPPTERRRRQAKAFAHVQFALAIVRHRMEHGRRALLGNPVCSQVWNIIKDELPPGLSW